jgi:hypothetical protein
MTISGWICAAICFVLSSIAYADFSKRVVLLWQMVALFVLCFSFRFTTTDVNLRHLLFGICANLSFVILQFGLLWAWFSLRSKRLAPLFQEYIGLGDLLFLFSVLPLFDFPQFIMYYVTGSFVVLICAIAVRFFTSMKNHSFSIPLAGGWAIWLILWLIAGDYIKIIIPTGIQLSRFYPETKILSCI